MLFYCGFKNHLQFPDSVDNKEPIKPLNNLPQLDADISKAYIGWCSLFIVTTNNQLYYIGYSDPLQSHSTPVLCNLSNINSTIITVEAGSKDVYLLTEDSRLFIWENFDFSVNPTELLISEFTDDGTVKFEQINSCANMTSVLLSNGKAKAIEGRQLVELDLPKIVQVSAGHEHLLLLSETGQVFSYGKGSKGQLGLDTLEDELDDPKLIPALDGIKIKEISAGGWHSMALSEDGDLYAFGWNESYQLGLPKMKSIKATPTLIDINGLPIQSVSCGSRHTMVLVEGGDLYAWGLNKFEQLGISKDIPHSDIPIKIESKNKYKSISCKYWSSLLSS